MTRKLHSTFILSCLVLVFACEISLYPLTTYAAGPKKRIAVIEFKNKTDYGKGKLGIAAADMMVTALVKSGAF